MIIRPVGTDVTLDCAFVDDDDDDGVTSNAIAWYFNNIPKASSGEGTLLLENVQPTDEFMGWYTCAASSTTERYELDFLLVIGGKCMGCNSGRDTMSKVGVCGWGDQCSGSLPYSFILNTSGITKYFTFFIGPIANQICGELSPPPPLSKSGGLKPPCTPGSLPLCNTVPIEVCGRHIWHWLQ